MEDDFYESERDQIKSMYRIKHQKFKKSSTYRATTNYSNDNLDRGIFYVNKDQVESFFNEFSINDYDIATHDSKLQKYFRINAQNKDVYEIKLDKRKNWQIDQYLNEESQKVTNIDLTNIETITVEKTKNKKNMHFNEYKIFKYSTEDTKEKITNIEETIITKTKKLEKQIRFREPQTKRTKEVKREQPISNENILKKIEIAKFVVINSISESNGLRKSPIKHYNRSSSNYSFVLKKFTFFRRIIHSHKNEAKTMKKNEKVRKRVELAKNATDEDFSLIKTAKNSNQDKEFNFYCKSIRQLFKKVKEIKSDGTFTFENLIQLEKTFLDQKNVEKSLAKELENTQINFKRDLSNQKCCVCFSEFDLNSKYFSLDPCGHTACEVCWNQYFANVLSSFTQFISNSDKITNQITCLYFECKSLINYQFLKEISFEEDLNKYIKYYCESKISNSDQYINCINSCGNLIVKNNNRMSTSICFCGYSICNDCKNESHYPLNCNQYFYFKDNFESSFQMSKVCMGKRCPKCKKFIEKNGGCNHMQCICGADFCWKCVQLYSNVIGHNTCKEIETQPFLNLDSNKADSSLEICLFKFLVLENFHKNNIIDYSRNYKSVLIDAVLKSKQKETLKTIFINESHTNTTINLKDEKIFKKTIESSIDYFLEFIKNSIDFYKKICVAQHFNLKNGVNGKKILFHVEQGFKIYKKFYSIFNRPFSVSSFIYLFFIYFKLLKCAKSIPKQ